MNILLPAFVIFAIVMVGMAVGVIFSNRRLKGSCGGLNTMQDQLGQPLCECGSVPGECGVVEKELEAAKKESVPVPS